MLKANGELIVSFQIESEKSEGESEQPEALQKKLQAGTELEITAHPDKKKVGQHYVIETVSTENDTQKIEAISPDGHRVFDRNGNFVSARIDNNVLLSKELSLSLNGFQHGINHNVLIIGGSGAGKTRYYAEPNIMQMNTSYAVTDPKSEILMKCGEMLRAAGYKVRVFNTIEMEHSNNYNPFHYCFDEKGQVSEVKVKKMVNVLFESTKCDGEKEDMWQQKGRTVIEAIVFLLFEESEYHI